MANNVPITAGSGTSIATDDVSSVHYQKVKLVDATEDSSTAIGTGGGTEAAALRVTVASDSTGNVGVSGAALTALQLIDDPVAVLGTATYSEATTKGAIAGAVRRDADTSAVNTDNEISPLVVDARGALKVEAFSGETLPVSLASVPSHAVTNAGVFATQVDGAALTALQLIDDPVQVLGTDTYTEATSKGMTVGAVRRDADTTLVNTTNEFGPLQMDANGRLKVEAFSGETLPVSIAAAVAVTQSGTWDEVGINDSGNSITVDAPVGTPVNVQIGNATLSAGVIDETGASAVDALAVGGGSAHDAVDSGNPIKVGGHAVSGSATPTSVAAADRVRWIFNQHGIPYILGGHPNLITREYDFGTAAQTDVNLAAAVVAADERCYVTRFEAMCDNANSVAVSVRAGFGASAVPTASASGVSGMIGSHPGVAPGSGFSCGTGAGIIGVGAAGEEPRLTSSAATSGNLHVIISYFIIDETP